MSLSAEAHHSSGLMRRHLSLFSCCFMLSSGRPAHFIFSIALQYSHLENVWSGLAANSELYFARLQNDSPTVQDCHWYMSMFCPVSPWTQCHIQLETGRRKLWVCWRHFKKYKKKRKRKRSAALMTVRPTKRLFTDCRHSLHEIYCLYDTHLWL